MTKERAMAFLAALTELCREHEVVIRCSGYECDGIALEQMKAHGSYEPDPVHWDEHVKLFNWEDT